VAGQISERSELAGATIMMLTSSGQYGDSAKCRELGISAYLTKPINAADLLGAIRRVLEPRQAATEPAPRVRAEPAVRHVKVLLVEDNLVNQRVAVGLLANRGHDVHVAGNGREALEAIEREPFDVVLMDLQMPEMGGIEATAAIRTREQQTGGHLRIVAMTAHTMRGDRERCLAAGMDGYLPKPVDPRLMFALVEHNGAVPQVKSASDPQPGVAPGGSEPAVVNRHDLLARLGGDEQLIADVIRVFLEDCPRQLTELKAAVDADRSDRVRSVAHALKGMAGNLSAVRLFEAARALEQIGADGNTVAAKAAWEHVSSEAARAMAALAAEKSL
jgi:two-component system, sensor histidine kinase and response regulator